MHFLPSKSPIVPPKLGFRLGSTLIYSSAGTISLFEEVLERAPCFLPARVQLARFYFERSRVGDAQNMIGSIHELAPHFDLGHAKRMFPYPGKVHSHRLQDALLAAEWQRDYHSPTS